MKKLLTLILLLAGISYAPAYAQTKKEVKQLEKQAKNGNIEATQTVFNIYYEGKGEIAKDENKAKFYGDLFINQLEANAAKGDLNSLDALFKSYKTGNELFPKDEAKAKHYGLLLVKQVEKDANAGNMDALDMLPQLYSNGVYVEKDEAKAQYWEKQYQEAKAAELRELPKKAESYLINNNSAELYNIISSAKSQDEADAILTGFIVSYYHYSAYSQQDLYNSDQLIKMVENYCSDLAKIAYAKRNHHYEISNSKIPKQIEDYLTYNFYKKLSDEGFAPATYKLVIKRENDVFSEYQVEYGYELCSELMKKAEGQQDVDKECVRNLISQANELSTKGYDWVREIKEDLLFLLNSKEQALESYSRLEKRMEPINKHNADLKRKEAQDARNLAACKKQYGAKYVDAIERFDLLPGTPYKLLQEYQKGGRLYRHYQKADKHWEDMWIEIYKRNQTMNATEYRVRIRGYNFNVWVQNGIVKQVGPRY